MRPRPPKPYPSSYGGSRRPRAVQGCDDGALSQNADTDAWLPFNDEGPGGIGYVLEAFPSEPRLIDTPVSFPDGQHVAGDFRATDHVTLTAQQSLWVRQHNRFAEYFDDGDRSDEDIYQCARALNSFLFNHIVFEEWVNILLGDFDGSSLGDYYGYDDSCDATVPAAHSTVTMRFGHTLTNSGVPINPDNPYPPWDEDLEEDETRLTDAFTLFVEQAGFDTIVWASTHFPARRHDAQFVDPLRNGDIGFDLWALDLQRERDHGIPNHNQLRENYDLLPIDFDDLGCEGVQLQPPNGPYETIEELESWSGGIAELPRSGSDCGLDGSAPTQLGCGVSGELFLGVQRESFRRMRDCDRFHWQNVLDNYFFDTECATDTMNHPFVQEVQAGTYRYADTIVANSGIQCSDFTGGSVFICNGNSGIGRTAGLALGESNECTPRDDDGGGPIGTSSAGTSTGFRTSSARTSIGTSPGTSPKPGQGKGTKNARLLADEPRHPQARRVL